MPRTKSTAARAERLRRLRRIGMTLVELVIALAIVGTLAAIAMPMYGQYMREVKLKETITEIREIEVLIARFESNATRLPDTLTEAGAGDRTDAWGNSYRYLRIQGAALKGLGQQRKDKNLVPVNSDYDLYSAGPDGATKAPFTAKAARDDIVRCRNGGWVGRAEDY